MTRSENAILRARLLYSSFLSSKVPSFFRLAFTVKRATQRAVVERSHIVIDWIVSVVARKVNVL
jgi:hypothetical protein